MRDTQFIHLATHGLAEERFGNLFGGLVLAPGNEAEPSLDDDALLQIAEIYRLPLNRCELAALSACNTNVGPQLPMEAGVTVANAFLMAGARRVVASHWPVEDNATAELMEQFFRQVLADGKGDPASYARALQEARRQVRKRETWRAPYFWAPFVLIGSGN
jgi:CHAT domain-containing protein